MCFIATLCFKTFAIAVISNGLKSNIRGTPELDGKITFMMLAGHSLAFHGSICSLWESINMLEAATVMWLRPSPTRPRPCKFFRTKTVFVKIKTFDFFQDQDHKNGIRINSLSLIPIFL